MTWVYVTAYNNPSDPLRYPKRAGMKIISCTFRAKTLTQARKFFERLSPTATYLHLTLSLPEGLRADDDLARRIMATELQLRGLPPDAVPWIMVRHTDTNCDHYHVVVQLRLITGMRLQARISEAVSRNNDRILRDLLCFPSQSHFDPDAMPILAPNVPKRRLNTPDKLRLHKDLQRVFLEDQPLDLVGLCDGMSRIESPFTILRVPGTRPDGRDSYRATGPASVLLSAFGKAWWPSAIDKRFNHAAVLRTLRPVLQFRSLITGLVRAEKENLNDPRGPHPSLAFQRHRNPDEQNRASQKPCGIPAAPARSVDNTTGGGGSGHDHAPLICHDSRGSGIKAAHASARRSEESIGKAGTQSGYHEENGERYASTDLASDGPKPGRGWLGGLKNAAKAKGGRLLRLLRSDRGTFAAGFAFEDGGIIYGDQYETWVVRQSLKADDFVHESAKQPSGGDSGCAPTF